MEATLIHAVADPRLLGEAIRSVRDELVPGFLANPGARHGYWMAHRSSGRLLILNVWDSAACMASAAAAEAARRKVAAERVGIRAMAVHHMQVLGAHEEALDQSPRIRWVRVTWVGDLQPDRRRAVSPLYREAVPDQARARGFCASYWLADRSLGFGLGLSCWEGPAEIRDGEGASRQRRRRMEALLGCRVTGVQEYEALGVATTATGGRPTPATASAAPIPARFIYTGTSIERPPGSLLAMSGEQTDQMVLLVGGRASLIRDHQVTPLGPGHHFGGRRLAARQRHVGSVLATSPVSLQVISRGEFHEIAHDTPATAAQFVADDAEPADGAD
jgi:hypothetical protein